MATTTTTTPPHTMKINYILITIDTLNIPNFFYNTFNIYNNRIKERGGGGGREEEEEEGGGVMRPLPPHNLSP